MSAPGAASQAVDMPRRRGRARRVTRVHWRTLPRPLPELAGLLALAALLNLWALSRNGWANDYYSAAVRSMAGSWHNFLYGSFDAEWADDRRQAAARALGAGALGATLRLQLAGSILVPQALMGVASGRARLRPHAPPLRPAGRLRRRAGARAHADHRRDLAPQQPRRAAGPLLRRARCGASCGRFEDGRTRWLVLAGVGVGLGFEAKMGAALMVVPGIALAWLWVAPRGRLAALRQLLAGGAALVLVGGAWPLLVALTPAADRPWISGTTDNSIWSLITGYNGFGRLRRPVRRARAGGFGARRRAPSAAATGPLRLLNAALGGQAGWLLGFALVAGGRRDRAHAPAPHATRAPAG